MSSAAMIANNVLKQAPPCTYHFASSHKRRPGMYNNFKLALSVDNRIFPSTTILPVLALLLVGRVLTMCPVGSSWGRTVRYCGLESTF